MYIRLHLFVISFLLCLVSFAQKGLVNGTAASVGKVLITVEDAYFYRAIRRFVDGKGDPFDIEQGEALRRTVQKMIFQEMVFKEIKEFKFQGVKKGQAQEAIQEQKAKDKKKKKVWRRILKRFNKTEKEAVELLLKDMLVEKFVQQRVETLTPVITQSEIERYYQQNKSRFRGSDFDNLKPTIVLLLKKTEG